MLGEIRADPSLEIIGHRSLLLAELLDHFLDGLLDLAPRKEPIGLGELIVRGDDFRDAGFGQLILDEGDELIRGHRVELDALALHKEVDLGLGRAIVLEPILDLVWAGIAERHRFRYEPEFMDII